MHLTHEKPQLSKPCLICQFVKSDINYAATRLKRFVSREHISYVAKEHYKIPDSQSCNHALELVSSCSPDYLLNHCLRTYAFGVAISHQLKLKFDKEVFFLGSIMHDLGLTEKFDKGNTFEIDGAVAAQDFCRSQGMNSEDCDLVHEMVALHNSVGVADKREPEIALVHFGAGVDIAGIRIQDVHKRTLEEVVSQYPRLDITEAFPKLLNEQMARKPNSFMKPMVELGFNDRIKKNQI